MTLFKEQKIALVTLFPIGYTETFIQNHLENITINLLHYWGRPVPHTTGKINFVNHISFFNRLFFWFRKALKIETLKLEELVLLYKFRENQINGVLAHYGDTAIAVHRVAKKLNVPLWVYFHGADAFVGNKNSLKSKYKEVFKTAVHVFCVSQSMKKQLIELGLSKNKITVNPCVPHSNFFKTLRNPNGNILFVGRFVEKKNPEKVIKMFKRVWDQIPDIDLIMIGDGPLISKCKQLVNDLNITNQVKFMGQSTTNEVKEEMSKSNVLLHLPQIAANGDREGTPVVVLEALACGLPVVGSAHEGMIDIKQTSVNGIFLFDEAQDDEILLKLIEILKGEVFVDREKIERHYSNTKHINTIERELYKSLITQ